MTTRSYDTWMAAAEKRCKAMDDADRQRCSKTPAEESPQELLRTAMIALQAGINTLDWTCVADAQVYLRHLHRKIAGDDFV